MTDPTLPAPSRFAQEVPPDLRALNRAQFATVASLQLVAPELALLQTVPAIGLEPMPAGVFTIGLPRRSDSAYDAHGPYAPPRAFLHPDGSLRSFYAPACRGLESVHAIISGVEWSPDTLEEIGALVTAAGMTIDPPTDDDAS